MVTRLIVKSLAAPDGMRDTMLMKMMIDMPLPRPRAVMSSPSHITNTAPATRLTMMSRARHQLRSGSAFWLLEQEDVADRLHRRETDGEPARVLGDLLLPLLPSFGQSLELGDDHGEQLHDDRCRDVRHDAEREEGHARQRAAREQVKETDDPGAPLLEELAEGLEVDAGYRHVRAEAIDRHHRRREEELRAKVRDLPGVDQRLPELVVHSRIPNAPLSDELGRTAGRLDLLHSAPRVQLHADLERLVEVAAAEDLDRRARVLDDALGDQRLGSDLVAGARTPARGGRR